MKKITIISALILFIALTAQIGYAQTAKEKNRDSLANITKYLEETPFGDKADNYRNNAFKYVTETKDVTVVLCGGTMDLLPQKKNKYKGELLIQFTIGMASFKLSNPDQKDDENAAQLYGLESMLKSYESMVKEKKKAQNDKLDELLVKRGNSELKTLVEEADCGGKKKDSK